MFVQDVPNLQGGQLRWTEMMMEPQESLAGCGRNDLGKRARIISVEKVRKTD